MTIFLNTQIEDVLNGIEDYTFNDYLMYKNDGDTFCAAARLAEIKGIGLIRAWTLGDGSTGDLDYVDKDTNISLLNHIKNIISYSNMINEEDGDAWGTDAKILSFALDAMTKEAAV